MLSCDESLFPIFFHISIPSFFVAISALSLLFSGRPFSTFSLGTHSRGSLSPLSKQFFGIH
jgi:hypothetical protein